MNSYNGRVFTLNKHDPYYQQSTTQNFYNMQESQKMYQDLVQENMWLKQQIHGNHKIEDLRQHHRVPQYIRQHQQQQTDIPLWSMIERNRYLENKIDRLRAQYEKQSQSINNIKKSQKWKSRYTCNEDNCYHQKYIQLLKVKSPFY